MQRHDRSIIHADQPLGLKIVNLSGNLLHGLSQLDMLAPLAHLEDLRLEGNPCCSTDVSYRPNVLRKLKWLKVLDGM